MSYIICTNVYADRYSITCNYMHTCVNIIIENSFDVPFRTGCNLRFG